MWKRWNLIPIQCAKCHYVGLHQLGAGNMFFQTLMWCIYASSNVCI